MRDEDVWAALLRHWVACDAADFAAEHEIYKEHAVLGYPQYGECIRSRRRIQESRMAQPTDKRFTIRRLQGSGSLCISEIVIAYDEQPALVVSIMEFEREKVIRESQYFDLPFEPSPSRARSVERMD